MKNDSHPAPSDAAPTADPFGSVLRGMMKSMAGLNLPMQQLVQIQSDYVKSATEMWNRSLQQLPLPGVAGAADAAPPQAPAPIADKRFAASEWLANPAAALTAQMYLLNARALMQMAESVEGDAKTKARIRFAVQQWIDAASPSNFLALNPEALGKALTQMTPEQVVDEVKRAGLRGRDGGEALADLGHHAVEGSLAGSAQLGLEPGKGQFDRIEVG